MRRACRERMVSQSPLWQPRRFFQVIQRGHDKPQESLYDKLGFKRDDEAHRVRRSVPELQQGLLREVEQLVDPLHDPKDKKRLAELKHAYTLLHDDNFRANYGSHFYASNDAQLHVLCDGGQVAANFNPEHQQFTYVDHAIDRESHVSSSGNGGPHLTAREGQGEAGSSGEGKGHSRTFTEGTSSSSNATREAPSAEALRDAFRNATGVGSGTSGATSATARAFHSAEAAGPSHGADLTHLLRITLEQSLSGCEVAVELRKNVRCTTCRGSGRQRLTKPRRCPQCKGRGSSHLPSATYHIERRCLYCGGEGSVPPPPCTTCAGRGVLLQVPVTATVSVPAGTLSNTLFRLRHYGHDGVRGGHAGDLLVTVLVSEHRYFYRHKDRQDELHAMLPLPLSVALLGGRVEVPTLAGRGVLHVPPCVRNGQVLPFDVYGVQPSDLQSRSATTTTGQRASRLFFHALVMIPRVSELSGRQRQALDTYELSHASSSSPSPSFSTAAVTEAETVARVERRNAPSSEDLDTAAPAEAPPRTLSRDEMMAECAALKDVYKHWFTAN